MLATGEVQLCYRLVGADGSLEAAGVLLKAFPADEARVDDLRDLRWPRPPTA